MDSNIGKVVTYYEKRQLINSHNSLNKRSREVTWNNKLKTLYIKNILSPLPQYLWLSNVARWLHITLSLGAVSNFDYLITFLGLDRKHYSIHRLLVVFYFFFCMYFDLWLLIQGIYLYNFCWFQYNIFSLLWSHLNFTAAICLFVLIQTFLTPLIQEWDVKSHLRNQS